MEDEVNEVRTLLSKHSVHGETDSCVISGGNSFF